LLVPQYIIGIVYATLVQSYASEHSARMRAMDSATRNADKMLKELNMKYNRARQAAITEEIAEIIGGAGGLGWQ
jgi:F-type H+-transporting ATPase subunit gamma